jgi:hypothetical protein
MRVADVLRVVLTERLACGQNKTRSGTDATVRRTMSRVSAADAQAVEWRRSRLSAAFVT